MASSADNELFRAGQVRAIWRALGEERAQAAQQAIEREIALALATPGAPDLWVDGMQDIAALMREAFPESSSPPR